MKTKKLVNEFYNNSYTKHPFIHISPEMPHTHFQRLKYLFLSKSTKPTNSPNSVHGSMCMYVTRGPGLVQIDQELRALYIKNIGVILQQLGCYKRQNHESPFLEHSHYSLHAFQVWFKLAKKRSALDTLVTPHEMCATAEM